MGQSWVHGNGDKAHLWLHGIAGQGVWVPHWRNYLSWCSRYYHPKSLNVSQTPLRKEGVRGFTDMLDKDLLDDIGTGVRVGPGLQGGLLFDQ